jgi:hypothetical protein
LWARILLDVALFGFLDARDEQKRCNLYSGNIRNALFLPGRGAAPNPRYPYRWVQNATVPTACMFY